MRATEYIKHLLSLESYSFSLEEINRHTQSENTALKLELARLVKKKEIVSLRKGFYLILPPRYSQQGSLPIQLYIDKLFNSLNRNYYVGFYSAARFHGAAHQQTQREYVMIETPKLRDIKKGVIDIRFVTTSEWPAGNIVEKKSDAGTFSVSGPLLTITDLIHHQNKLGGINRMLATIEELSEEITETELINLLKWYPHKSTLQRLGFILEEVRPELKLSPLSDHLNTNPFFPVLLSAKGNQKPGSTGNKWKVDVNIKLENDL
ncbi:MAG: type IV toxin-antitoxin system AbiEi family antitoxin [Flavobacteriales bacterium]